VRNRNVSQPSAATRRSRRARQPVEAVVAELDRLVSALIKENRDLRRQLDRLSRQSAGATSGTVERTLRSIVRRLRNALSTGQSRARRRS
jgi:uncharacterized membrane protein